MSYADVAASGPPQSAEEARANPVDEVIPTDQSVDSLIDVNTGVTVVPNDFQEQEVKTETQAERIELEQQAAAEAARLREEEEKKRAAEKRKAKAKKSAKGFAENPISLVNAGLIATVSAILGYGAVRKHQAGKLNWKLAGIWAAGVAAFGGVDYALSSWLYKKYEAKKNSGN